MILDSLISPGLVLGNRILMSFVPLLTLTLSPVLGAPPKLGPFLLSVVVWAIPDLLVVRGSLSVKGKAPLVMRAVVAAQTAGYVTIGVVFATGIGLRAAGIKADWWLFGFIAFFLGMLLEETYLRRNLRRLAVLDR